MQKLFVVRRRSPSWSFYDNLVDTCTNFYNLTAQLAHNYNGYYLSTNFYSTYGTGGADVLLSSLPYQSSILGNYYLDAASPLINVGSRYATNAGLYHFTLTTNQVQEATSLVDIGFHFVAMDLGAGLPWDQDGDQLADYFEDRNGNGAFDPEAGETDWESYDSTLGIGDETGLKVFTPLK